MKCPKCGGNAELSNWGSYIDPDYADFHVECEKCGYHSMGSTDPQKAKEMFEKEMGLYYTNEQWFCLLSTEEKARFFDKICYSAWGDINSRFRDMADYTDWMEWLKEKHE